jgi:hypothetical protein
MAILIDPPQWWNHERWWGHMVSDVSLDELHEFTQRLGIPERGFDRDHYDIPEQLQHRAIEEGAFLVSSRELMERLRASGLRKRKQPQHHCGDTSSAEKNDSVAD